jgi:hypothetical protein
MTQEEKELLLRDLCGRLPYFTIAYVTYKEGPKTMEGNLPVTTDDIDMLYESVDAIEEAHYTIKPYLRPMSSMSKEERKYLLEELGFDEDLENGELNDFGSYVYRSVNVLPLFDWLNENKFDYRGLIEKGLALEAPEGMY